MNESLRKFIEDLSKKDKKTLSQKALKLSEEVGELAKAVLPYENAYATTHRFIEKEKILEEVADSILVAQSIAYDLGFSYEELMDVIQEKSLKWSNLQLSEDEVKYPIPYEIHITVSVRRENVDEKLLNRFKVDCESIGVKPILLDLHTKTETIKDLMTSSIFYGDNRGSYEESKRISKALQKLSYIVIREKIETVPWHPAAPCKKFNKLLMPNGCYFECHVSVITTKDNLERLKEISELYEARLSRNVFKKIDNEKFVIMTTLRNYKDPIEEFKEKVNNFVDGLKHNNFEIKKEIIEFSVYDTDIDHDKEWIV